MPSLQTAGALLLCKLGRTPTLLPLELSMKVQHAAASWTYDSDVICDANGNEVCTLFSPEICGDPTIDGPAWQQTHANGWLIAAAPDLLRACRAAVAYWDSRFAANRREALRIISEAISKAEGTQ